MADKPAPGGEQEQQPTAGQQPANAEATPANAEATPDLSGQLAEALTVARDALKAQHPELPETVFEAGDVGTLKRQVDHAVDIASHVREAVSKESSSGPPSAAGSGDSPPPTAPAAVPASPATRTPPGPPEGIRGRDRIRYGLENRQTPGGSK